MDSNWEIHIGNGPNATDNGPLTTDMGHLFIAHKMMLADMAIYEQDRNNRYTLRPIYNGQLTTDMGRLDQNQVDNDSEHILPAC